MCLVVKETIGHLGIPIPPQKKRLTKIIRKLFLICFNSILKIKIKAETGR